MTGSDAALQSGLLDSSVNLIEETDWERKLFYLLTPALMGDPFMTPSQFYDPAGPPGAFTSVTLCSRL